MRGFASASFVPAARSRTVPLSVSRLDRGASLADRAAVLPPRIDHPDPANLSLGPAALSLGLLQLDLHLLHRLGERGLDLLVQLVEIHDRRLSLIVGHDDLTRLLLRRPRLPGLRMGLRQRGKPEGKGRRDRAVHGLGGEIELRALRQRQRDRAVHGLERDARAASDRLSGGRDRPVDGLGLERLADTARLDLSVDALEIQLTVEVLHAYVAVDRLESDVDPRRHRELVARDDAAARAGGAASAVPVHPGPPRLERPALLVLALLDPRAAEKVLGLFLVGRRHGHGDDRGKRVARRSDHVARDVLDGERLTRRQRSGETIGARGGALLGLAPSTRASGRGRGRGESRPRAGPRAPWAVRGRRCRRRPVGRASGCSSSERDARSS